MKEISSKRKFKRTSNIWVIIFNGAIFLVDPPSNFCDWTFKIIEFLAFINILIASWRWSISNNGYPFIYLFSKKDSFITQVKYQTLGKPYYSIIKFFKVKNN